MTAFEMTSPRSGEAVRLHVQGLPDCPTPCRTERCDAVLVWSAATPDRVVGDGSLTIGDYPAFSIAPFDGILTIRAERTDVLACTIRLRLVVLHL
jgi:hypothetical protein